MLYTEFTLYTYTVDLVPLSCLYNLERLNYRVAYIGDITGFVHCHLGTVHPDNKITHITFRQEDDLGHRVGDIDDMLTSKRFPFLETVQVENKGHIDLFPKLVAQGVEINSVFSYK